MPPVQRADVPQGRGRRAVVRTVLVEARARRDAHLAEHREYVDRCRITLAAAEAGLAELEAEGAHIAEALEVHDAEDAAAAPAPVPTTPEA